MAKTKARKEAEAQAKKQAKAQAQAQKEAEAQAKAQVKAQKEADTRAEAQAKAQAEAEAKVKAEAEAKEQLQTATESAAKASAKYLAELRAEAKVLGITESRITVAGSRVKDKPKELSRHQAKAVVRLEKRIAKKKAELKANTMEKRKLLLETRLKRPQQYTREQLLHFRAELHAMEKGVWFVPYMDSGKLIVWTLPKKKTAIEQFLNT